MEMKLKKRMEDLQKDVVLKSIDLDDDIDDFEVDIGAYEVDDNLITISPRCVRCDSCVNECPVNAISSSTLIKTAQISDDCVKCNICAQTCPISCIYVMNTKTIIDKENNDVEYQLEEIKVPHRVFRMKNIDFDRTRCEDCGNCVKFCPTKAISLKNKSIIEAADDTSYPDLEDRDYPYIEEKLCIGCGSCANLCENDVITIERELGPIIPTKNLCINQDACVQCYLCEENCPVEAIKLDDDKVVLDKDKCIRCNVCSTKCPVGTLTLKNLSDNIENDEDIDNATDVNQ